MDDLTPWLARIPQFAAHDRRRLRLTRLGGLTNRVYRLEHGDTAYTLRVPGPGTTAYLDRAAEAYNLRLAAAAGLCPAPLYVDESDGLLLTPHLPGCPLDRTALRQPQHVAAAATLLRRLHALPTVFQGRFDPLAALAGYRALLGRRDALPGAAEAALWAGLEARLAALPPGRSTPCHGDPVPDNFLQSSGQLYLLDWEYSGQGDPLWDLAGLSVEADFAPAQDHTLLAAYQGAVPPAALLARFRLYQAGCELLGAVWGLVQRAAGNDALDFATYAAARFARAAQRLADSDGGAGR